MTGATTVLVVGPTGGKTGGVRRYILGQVAHLPPSVSARVYDVGAAEGEGVRALLTAALVALVRLFKFPLQARPDIVHVHSSHYRSFVQSAGYVLYAAYVWQVPVVVHIHGSSFDRFVHEASPPVRWFQRLVFDACDTVVVLSEYWRDVLSRDVPADKLAVLPNAVDVAAYHPVAVTGPHVCYVSDHIDRKGLPEFVAAVRELDEAGVRPRVTIAGRGPRSPLAEALAADYPHVEYVGYITEAEKRQLLASTTIYVLPTYAEGLPIAILEAMAGGNAIVSTTVGSIPSVVDDTTGRLVAPGETAALTAALAELVADDELSQRMGETSRARALAEYDWPAVVTDLVSLYDSLCPSPSPSAPLSVTPSDG